MTQITLYHNPRCSKSRQALALLEAQQVVPDIRLYLQQAPTAAEIGKLLKKLGLSARELLRKGETPYRELGLEDNTLTEAALIKAMVQAPILIERPIAITAKRAVIGRPPEAVLELLP